MRKNKVGKGDPAFFVNGTINAAFAHPTANREATRGDKHA